MDREALLCEMENRLKDPEQMFILSTLTSDGYPDARLMGNICGKTAREVFFTCRAGTRKIGEIAENPRSCVYFTCGDETFWLYGESSASAQRELRHGIWNERMRPVYPGGADSPDLTVIRFVPKKVRYRGKTGGYAEFSL